MNRRTCSHTRKNLLLALSSLALQAMACSASDPTDSDEGTETQTSAVSTTSTASSSGTTSSSSSTTTSSSSSSGGCSSSSGAAANCQPDACGWHDGKCSGTCSGKHESCGEKNSICGCWGN